MGFYGVKLVTHKLELSKYNQISILSHSGELFGSDTYRSEQIKIGKYRVVILSDADIIINLHPEDDTEGLHRGSVSTFDEIYTADKPFEVVVSFRSGYGSSDVYYSKAKYSVKVYRLEAK